MIKIFIQICFYFNEFVSVEADCIRENGTGLVHTAQVMNDRLHVGVKNNINIFSPVDDTDEFTDGIESSKV